TSQPSTSTTPTTARSGSRERLDSQSLPREKAPHHQRWGAFVVPAQAGWSIGIPGAIGHPDRITSMKAAIYARISLDRDGTYIKVENQLGPCHTFAEERGWEVGQ